MILDTTADNCDRLRRNACRADGQCSQMLRQSEEANTAKLNLRASAPRFEFPAGAVASDVLKRGINQGMCLESSVASDGFNPSLGVSVNQLLTYNAMAPNCPDCQRESSIRAVFPRFQGNIAAILDNYTNVDPMSEFMKSCQRVQLPSNQRPSVVSVNPSDFSRELEKPNPEPIGVNYSASIFDYSSEAVAASYDAPGTVRPTNRPLHYSLLLGKRYNCSLGEEEFILRNSWGKGSCESDRQKYVSVAKTDSRVAALAQDNMACSAQCRQRVRYDPGIRTRCPNVSERSRVSRMSRCKVGRSHLS